MVHSQREVKTRKAKSVRELDLSDILKREDLEELRSLDKNTRLEIIEKLIVKLNLTEDDIRWLEKEIEKRIKKELSMMRRQRRLEADRRLR